MPTPIYSIPIFNIEQARAVASVLLGYLDATSPSDNVLTESQLAAIDSDEHKGISAAWCHLDAFLSTQNNYMTTTICNIVSVAGITAQQMWSSVAGSHQRLWRVQTGALILYRVTSKSTRFEAETYIFAATEDGIISDWIELAGSAEGEHTHEDVIAAHMKYLSNA